MLEFISFFSRDWLGITLLAMFAVVILMVAALILSGIWYLVDTVGMPYFEGKGTVIAHRYSSEYTVLMPMQSGNITILMPINHPESFELKIRASDGREAFADVDEELFGKLKDGARVELQYRTGRLSGGMHISEVYSA